MRSSLDRSGITATDLIFFLIAAFLLIVMASVLANGQSEAPAAKAAKAHAQLQQPLYKEYRGVRLGMTATEVRTKLGEPALKSDEQDFFVVSATESAQIAYNTALQVVTISTDYSGGVGAPNYSTIVGGNLLTRPDGSMFRMVLYDSERFWVSYNKSAATVPTVTITIGAYK